MLEEVDLQMITLLVLKVMQQRGIVFLLEVLVEELVQMLVVVLVMVVLLQHPHCLEVVVVLV